MTVYALVPQCAISIFSYSKCKIAKNFPGLCYWTHWRGLTAPCRLPSCTTVLFLATLVEKPAPPKIAGYGIVQDDPTALGAYALGILPLIKFLLEFINLNDMNAKEVAMADGFFVAGSLNSIKNYWDKLTASGPKYGYFPKPTKSYPMVKQKN